MKKLTSFILILVMSCQCMVQMGIMTYYQLNKDYIAEVLCINREKPELHCEGKCFLTEKLNTAQQTEENLPAAAQQEKIDIPAFLISRHSFRFTFLSISPLKYPLAKRSFAVLPHASGVFHPPQA